MTQRRLPLILLLSLTMVGGPLWPLDSVPALLALQTAGSTVSPAQAAPFIGDWTAPITSQMGPMTFAV